jgi:biotin carboxyl carrier protein
LASNYRLTMQGVAHDVEVTDDGDRSIVRIDGRELQADMHAINGSLLSLLLDGRSFEVVAVEHDFGYEIVIGSQSYEIEVDRAEPHGARGERLRGTTEGRGDVLRSPMTGVVIEVVTQAGATVSAGQVLVIVESMKMNNELRSPRDGVVDTVHVQQGERVERNATLVTIR